MCYKKICMQCFMYHYDGMTERAEQQRQNLSTRHAVNVTQAQHFLISATVIEPEHYERRATNSVVKNCVTSFHGLCFRLASGRFTRIVKWRSMRTIPTILVGGSMRHTLADEIGKMGTRPP